MLIGSMGSGKSHFGRNLAERKGWQFVDTDRVLESRFGLPIAEIFKKIGEKAFRRAVTSHLKGIKKIFLYYWYPSCTIPYCQSRESPCWETAYHGL